MYRKVKRSVCEIIAYICGISGSQKNLRKLFLCLCENKNRVIFISFFFSFFFFSLLAFDPSLLNLNHILKNLDKVLFWVQLHCITASLLLQLLLRCKLLFFFYIRGTLDGTRISK